MLKRTLYFSNPFYLSTRLQQLVITQKETGQETTVPIEDIGFIIFDHREINISTTLIHHLAENNVAVVFCNETHHPHSMLLPLDHHQTQAERFKYQLEAAEPLKKQLWAQTIKAKIKNQQKIFEWLEKETQPFNHYISQIKSGDTSNEEAQASRYYWQNIFSHLPQVQNFRRDRFGDYPNNFLNFGYIILRSAVARALVGSGRLPTLGIHHRNRYNAFQLADDIMEPYRAWVDKTVVEIIIQNSNEKELTKQIKAQLIGIITLDTLMDDEKSPLMIALNKTTSSLAKCFMSEEKQIIYPVLI
jgi:CRISP-associated protein Cas1